MSRVWGRAQSLAGVSASLRSAGPPSPATPMPRAMRPPSALNGAPSSPAARPSTERDGRPISADVLDLRSLTPLDMDAIERSVKKTNRVLVAHEDSKSWGWGAEISARLAEDLFEWLDAPIRRLASTDTFVGYAPQLEEAILPQVVDIAAAMEKLKAY